MTARDRAYIATVAGAIAGGAVGFFFFTDRGKELRRQLEPTIEGLADELVRFRGTLLKAVAVANDGWGLMNELAGEVRSWSVSDPSLRQSRPF